MRVRFLPLIVLIGAPAIVLPVVAATRSSPPLARDGHPDLQGTYDLGTLTPLERAPNMPSVLSDAEAAKLEQQILREMQAGALPSRGDRSAPPVGGDGSKGPAGNVGGYNTFWLDPGSHFTTINGQRRTALVIDPPDGHVPPLTAEAKQRNAARAIATTSDQQSREN